MQALALSRLPLPGGHVSLPFVVTLIGHTAGSMPGEGKGQKDQVRGLLGAQVEPEVRPHHHADVC